MLLCLLNFIRKYMAMKNNTFRQWRLFFLLFVTSGLFFVSCYDENNSFGKHLVSSSFRNMTTDTCTVLLTTLQIDSLETSGKSVVLAGRYTHPLWGTASVSSYIAYSCPSYVTDMTDAVVFDSLMLHLTPYVYTNGDTTRWQKIDIHRLAEKIELNNNGYLYSSSTVAYDSGLIGSLTFKPKPRSGEKLEVRLSDELGMDLLEKFHNRSPMVSEDAFEGYFKGIAIVPDRNVSEAFFSFQLSDTVATLTLYYHLDDGYRSEKSLVFAPKSDTQFNHLDYDASETVFDSFVATKEDIPSAAVGNRALLSGLTGFYTRVEFPYINNLLQQGVRVEVQSAMLYLYPEYRTYSEYNELPDSIYLYIADENNVVTEAVTDYLGSEVQSGKLVKDDVYYRNTHYYFDITSFIQEEMGAFGMYKHNLQLVLPSTHYTSSLKNLTVGNQASELPIRLNITYKVYESN